jgi:hypothetical protein
MPTDKDRFPTTRIGQLTAGKNRVIVLNANAAAWNVPVSMPAELQIRVSGAEITLTAAQNEDARALHFLDLSRPGAVPRCAA